MTGKTYTNTTLELIKDFEGRSLTAYEDPKGSGKYSIGYGCQFYENWQRVKQNDEISAARANTLLEFHVKANADYVNRYVTVILNQNQFDALTSLMYNVGPGNFTDTYDQVLKAVNEDPNDIDAVTKAFTSINFNKNRRLQEATIYAQGTFAKTVYNLLYLVLFFLLIYLLRRKQ
ncbi:lysozyme [Runella sp.]|uniref:lysozyme n=1 Tax=Runella sp. TaxID=1960881 RepID=UPI003D147A84